MLKGGWWDFLKQSLSGNFSEAAWRPASLDNACIAAYAATLKLNRDRAPFNSSVSEGAPSLNFSGVK